MRCGIIKGADIRAFFICAYIFLRQDDSLDENAR